MEWVGSLGGWGAVTEARRLGEAKVFEGRNGSKASQFNN